MNTIWILATAACLSACPAFAAEWNYEDRDYWPEIASTDIPNNVCWGQRQSPIDIDTSDVYDEITALPLSFSNYGMTSGTITNSGYHTLKFELANCAASTTVISGGLLNGKSYKFCQLHFHWGSHSDQGSEHTIDGKEYPLEMHMVHFASTSTTGLAGATNANGGLLVTSFLFHIGKKDNPLFAPFVTAATGINAAQSGGGSTGQTTVTTQTAMIDLKKFYDELEADVYPEGVAYYTYEGSLTTPPCTEMVTFIVFERTISISESQLNTLRTKLVYEDGAPMVDNYRHPQPIENRIVKRVLLADNIRTTLTPTAGSGP